MHERTQRGIARLLFVLCCALPTSITLYYVLVAWTPWHHHQVLAELERQLSQAFELNVEIADFQQLSPTSRVLRQVQATDPENGHEVFKVREVHWVDRDDEVSIVLGHPEIQSRKIDKTWSLIHDRVLCQPSRTKVPIRVTANALTIHGKLSGLTLRSIDAWIGEREEVAEVSIQGQPAFSDSPISVTVRRDRDASRANPITWWDLNTFASALPCSVLVDYFPELANLGPEASFQGNVRWQSDGDDWWIDLSGSSFDQVSLDSALRWHMNRITGTAKIQLDRCRIHPEQKRLDVVGTLTARDGRIAPQVLYAMNRHLGFDVWREVYDLGENVLYDLIALRFDLHNTELELTGVCRNQPEYHWVPQGGAICFSDQLLAISDGTPVEALEVVNMVAPSHSVMVPMSEQTNWLTRILLPPSRPASLDDQRFPPRITSAGTAQGGPMIFQPDQDALRIGEQQEPVAVQRR